MIQLLNAPSTNVSSIVDSATADPTTNTTCEIAGIANEMMRRSPYASLRQVTCRFQEGVLILSGQVPSFYMKQMAQESVRNLSQVVQIDNRLVVPESSARLEPAK